jgi:hypothetical protein
VRLIKEALLDLIISGLAAVLLFYSVQELIRTPGVSSAMLGGLLPVTTIKWPWVVVIAVVLLVLWLRVRALGARRGVTAGAIRWLVRLGLWWSLVALLVFTGAAIDGALHRNLSDLNWSFAGSYLGLDLAVLLGCAYARARLMRAQRHSP